MHLRRQPPFSKGAMLTWLQAPQNNRRRFRAFSSPHDRIARNKKQIPRRIEPLLRLHASQAPTPFSKGAMFTGFKPPKRPKALSRLRFASRFATDHRDGFTTNPTTATAPGVRSRRPVA